MRYFTVRISGKIECSAERSHPKYDCFLEVRVIFGQFLFYELANE